MQRWGDLATFLIGFLIGILIPDRTHQNTEIIKDYIRGNLTSFETVFDEACKLLESIEHDNESCFLM